MDKTCKCCGKKLPPHPNVHNYCYCNHPECQKKRRSKWQKQKLASDKDYRENQAKAQKEYHNKHADYYKKYREKNPKYTERNRIAQRERNRKKRGKSDVIANPNVIATMDSSPTNNTVIPGRYKLVPVCNQPDGWIATMDPLFVEISIISTGYPAAAPISP